MGKTIDRKADRRPPGQRQHGPPGAEVALRIDQTLTQDATGTMAYLEFEAMGIDRVRTERSVAYIDHNTLQSGFENADDHRYIQSVAKKHGIWFSRPGNGICHQVHLERFGIPGKTLIGSDSHTPTGGGIGMLAFGAGGLDVAVAMGGGAYYITMPKMVKVESDRTAAAPSSPPRTSAWRCCGCSQRQGRRGHDHRMGRRRRRRPCPFRSGPPSPTWARSWAPPPPSSPPMR